MSPPSHGPRPARHDLPALAPLADPLGAASFLDRSRHLGRLPSLGRFARTRKGPSVRHLLSGSSLRHHSLARKAFERQAAAPLIALVTGCGSSASRREGSPLDNGGAATAGVAGEASTAGGRAGTAGSEPTSGPGAGGANAVGSGQNGFGGVGGANGRSGGALAAAGRGGGAGGQSSGWQRASGGGATYGLVNRAARVIAFGTTLEPSARRLDDNQRLQTPIQGGEADHPGMVPLVLTDVFTFFDGVRQP
jgi:hypothetical protein